MQTGTILVALLFAATSFPFLGQAANSEPQQSNPAMRQGASPAAQPGQADAPASAPENGAASAASAPSEMRTVRAELVSALDSKTAKSGDNVVVQTKDSVKTADGTDLPKGTKLVGHVVGVQASSAGKNSEVAVEFDHAEMAGGKNVPIQSQIQSLGSSESASSASAASDMERPMTSPSAGAMAGGAPGSAATPGAAGAAAAPGMAPAPAMNRQPPAGTVVAHTGQIAIKTTSIPGVLLANNEPGQQDPRMAHASSILLGAKKDVSLKEGTPVVVGVATGGSAKQ